MRLRLDRCPQRDFFRKLGNPKEAYGDEVHQILIDRDGYAWIITTDRLLRFDGKT